MIDQGGGGGRGCEDSGVGAGAFAAEFGSEPQQSTLFGAITELAAVSRWSCGRQRAESSDGAGSSVGMRVGRKDVGSRRGRGRGSDGCVRAGHGGSTHGGSTTIVNTVRWVDIDRQHAIRTQQSFE